MSPADIERPGADPDPAPSDLAAQARAAVDRYPECFWYWRPDARIRSVEDVRLVVRQLRTYGDRAAWAEAQELQRCLSRHSRRRS